MAMPHVGDIVYMARDVATLRKGDTVIVREVAMGPDVWGEYAPYPVVVEPHGMLLGQEERAIPLTLPVTLDEITDVPAGLTEEAPSA